MPLPDPAQAVTLDDLVAKLRMLKAESRDMSYAAIARAVNARWRRAGRPDSELTTKSTVAGYFAFGRSRLDEELLVAIVSVLHPDPEYAERWRHALRAIRGDATAATIVDTWSGLPAAPSGFVGRYAELRRFGELTRAPGIVVVHGMLGIGKTWFTAYAARRLLGDRWGRHLPLAADLRGSAPDAPPACPSAVLAGFLRLLGLRRDQIPRDVEARAETYRSLTRELPIVVILDDAADEESVAPLLPDGRDSFVLITSRQTLTGLPDAVHLALPPLAADHSIDLLRQVAGTARVDGEVAAARRIAAQVGHHPLALTIIGTHLRDHADWRLADCARPVTLALARGLRSAFVASYRGIPAATQRVLRLLALHPGPDVAAGAVAALADLTVDLARAHLARLVKAHLIGRTGSGRYVLHPLVRGFAAELVRLEEPAGQVRAATTRLFHYYRRTAARMVSRILSDTGTAPSNARVIEAQRWLAEEYANLLRITAYAAAHGWSRYAVDLATILSRHRPIAVPATVSGHVDRASEIVRGG